MKTFDNGAILLGESSQENWDLIDRSEGHHWWFHLKSFPSGHLVTSQENPDIKLCAEIVKSHTKFKNVPNIKVSYTQCSNLVRGEEVGSVYFRSNRKVKDFQL